MCRYQVAPTECCHRKEVHPGSWAEPPRCVRSIRSILSENLSLFLLIRWPCCQSAQALLRPVACESFRTGQRRVMVPPQHNLSTVSFVQMVLRVPRLRGRKESAFTHSRPCHVCQSRSASARRHRCDATAVISDGSLSLKHPVLSECGSLFRAFLLSWLAVLLR